MKKKELNFEINLLPVISLLAVCISFLLLTTVWVQIGTMDVKQALGDSSEVTKEDTPSLWIMLDNSGDLIFQLKNFGQGFQKQVRFAATKQGMRWADIESYAAQLKSRKPELNVALVFPDRQTNLDAVIKTIDALKKAELNDVGVAPL